MASSRFALAGDSEDEAPPPPARFAVSDPAPVAEAEPAVACVRRHRPPRRQLQGADPRWVRLISATVPEAPAVDAGGAFVVGLVLLRWLLRRADDASAIADHTASRGLFRPRAVGLLAYIVEEYCYFGQPLWVAGGVDGGAAPLGALVDQLSGYVVMPGSLALREFFRGRAWPLFRLELPYAEAFAAAMGVRRVLRSTALLRASRSAVLVPGEPNLLRVKRWISQNKPVPGEGGERTADRVDNQLFKLPLKRSAEEMEGEPATRRPMRLRRSHGPQALSRALAFSTKIRDTANFEQALQAGEDYLDFVRGRPKYVPPPDAPAVMHPSTRTLHRALLRLDSTSSLLDRRDINHWMREDLVKKVNIF